MDPMEMLFISTWIITVSALGSVLRIVGSSSVLSHTFAPREQQVFANFSTIFLTMEPPVIKVEGEDS